MGAGGSDTTVQRRNDHARHGRCRVEEPPVVHLWVESVKTSKEDEFGEIPPPGVIIGQLVLRFGMVNNGGGDAMPLEGEDAGTEEGSHNV